MKTCKHQNTVGYCGLCAVELEPPKGLPFVNSTPPSGLTSTQIAPRPSRQPEPGTNTNEAHWANGSKPTAALCDVITMLEPLSSEQRAKVIAATSAWFEGEQ